MSTLTKRSILIVEDHVDIATMVESYLAKRGFEVDYAGDGLTGLHLAVSNTYNAIVLDLNLPGLDGISICEKLRSEAKVSTPIIMLTAKDTLDEKLEGLNVGADDYLIKPFAIKELEARLNSLIRRHSGETVREVLQISDLELDTSTMQVSRNNHLLKLTPIGFDILKVLMQASPAMVSRQDLEQKVWGDILPDSDTLRSHIYNLRKIVDKPFEVDLIQTIQGRGFKIIGSSDRD
ncbi:MAG: response regulator transcription factor [Pseudomonadota bacterium]